MEVEEHQDAVRAAEGDHGRDPIEVGGVEPAARGLERAPADRQAEQVETEARHGGRVAVVEDGDRLEREAAVVEGDVEDALDARVHAAQRDLAPAPVDQPAPVKAEPAPVERAHGRDREREQHDESEHGAHLGLLRFLASLLHFCHDCAKGQGEGWSSEGWRRSPTSR